MFLTVVVSERIQFKTKMWLIQILTTILQLIVVCRLSIAIHYKRLKSGYSLTSSFLGSNTLRTMAAHHYDMCALTCDENLNGICFGFHFADVDKKCYFLDKFLDFNTDIQPSTAKDRIYYKNGVFLSGNTCNTPYWYSQII